jgi:hypothetical protein
MGLVSILSFAQKLMAERVQLGSVVIDATVGNGVDSLFLATLVGPNGVVYGFDVQETALANARQRLQTNGVWDVHTIRLFAIGHQELMNNIDSNHIGIVSGVMFNLGYLPGSSEQHLITLPATTIQALEASCSVLKQGGLITIVIYTGHDGGEQEAMAVEQWATSLPQFQFDVVRYQFLNRKKGTPYVIAIEKK